MLSQNSDFVYGYSDRPTSPNVRPHFHNCYEMLFYQKGDAEYLVESNRYALSEGDLLITNPREMHCPVFKSNQRYCRTIIFLKPAYLSEFITSDYDPFVALNNRKIGTQNKIDAALIHKYGIDQKIASIGELVNCDLPERKILIKTYLLQVLVQINRIVTTEFKPVKSSKTDEIIQYINQNLTETITLDNLSETFHLNKYHISHIFKEKTGFTIIEYITHKRIMLAKELILQNMPLSQVSEETGFHEYSSFYRAFCKIIGTTPSQLK